MISTSEGRAPRRLPAPGARHAAAALLAAALAWAYWPALAEMVRRWSTDARYSHGYLVPLFSVYLLRRRGAETAASISSPGSAAGLLPLAAGLALRIVGGRTSNAWLEGISLLPVLAGVALLAGGRRALGRAALPIAFLAFMVPLPYRIEVAMAGPLQRLATRASTYAMQTIGLPAIAEGNVIHIDEIDIGVVEACSGLSMLFTFAAIAAGAAILMERPWVDRAVVALSAIPIALAANVTRVTATGVLHATVGARVAGVVFHDLAGWLMMPMAVALLWAEEVLLRHLLLEPAAAEDAEGLFRGRDARRAPAGDRRGGDDGRARPRPADEGRSPAAALGHRIFK